MGIFDFFKKETEEEKEKRIEKRILNQIHVNEVTPNQLQLRMINQFKEYTKGSDGVCECYKGEFEKESNDFGLSPNNPIPVYGIINIPNYMDKLRYKYISKTNKDSYTYNHIQYVRKGTYTATNIDIYDIFGALDAEKSNLLATIYVHAYHLKTSNKIPKGFVHKDDIPANKDGKYLLKIMENLR
jgi:hypothetical protein